MGFVPSHIRAQKGDVQTAQEGGRVFLMPGSPARARKIAERFEDAHCVESPRGHDVHTGFVERNGKRFDLGCVSSGMGCPSLGIIARELIALDVRCMIRVGSAGSLQEEIRGGHVVIATGAVRDEGASDSYAPREFPAIAGSAPTRALEEAARALLPAGEFHTGIVHSKDSLYGREFGDGPRQEINDRYLQELTALGVVASEMEASHLFVLSQAHRVDAGCVLGILGGPDIDSTPEEREQAETRAVDVAIEGAVRWLSRE